MEIFILSYGHGEFGSEDLEAHLSEKKFEASVHKVLISRTDSLWGSAKEAIAEARKVGASGGEEAVSLSRKWGAPKIFVLQEGKVSDSSPDRPEG